MIFSSVGLFLISSTLPCIATATRRPSHQGSEALIPSIPQTEEGSTGDRPRKVVHVSAEGIPTAFEAAVIEDKELELGKQEHFAAADLLAPTQGNLTEGSDLQKPNAVQLAVSLLVQQYEFYVEEEDYLPIRFKVNDADSLYIDYFQTWIMSAGDPRHVAYIYHNEKWEQLDVTRALELFVAPKNLPTRGKDTKPFLLSGVLDQSLALLFGYVDVVTEELKIVKLLYLVPATIMHETGNLKLCDMLDDRRQFEVRWGKTRQEVFSPDKHPEPELNCKCGYSLRAA